jgi:hypothetical protein
MYSPHAGASFVARDCVLATLVPELGHLKVAVLLESTSSSTNYKHKVGIINGNACASGGHCKIIKVF